MKWSKFGVAPIIFMLMGLGIIVFGLVHVFQNNQVSPDFVLTTVGVVFVINSGMIGLVNQRIDDLGKRIDERFNDLGLSPKGKTKK